MEKFIENAALCGIFGLKVFQSGKLIEEIEEKNLIVAAAWRQLAHLIAGDVTGRNITGIAFGTGGNAADLSDTVITNQWSKPVSGFFYTEPGKVTFNWTLGIHENNGMAIREFGLLTEDGTLFARRTRANPLNKAIDISVEGYWTIIFNS